MQNLFRYLDASGFGGGSKDGAVDGSSTPVILKLKPENKIVRIHQLIVHIRCSNAGFDMDDYGDVSVLANGVLVQVKALNDDRVILDLLDGMPVQNNSAWARVTDNILNADIGAGDAFVTVRWNFVNSGRPVELTNKSYFTVTIQDNLAGLVEHTFMVQGVTG